MSGMQQMLLARGTATSTTYLDSLATLPRAAFGLRKLISTATLCCRVRNTATTVETDIGFSGNSIDTAALAACVSGAQALTIAKWYDQTGNAEDLESVSTGRQPHIYNGSGSYLGTISFGSIVGDNILKITSLTLGTPQIGLYMRHSFTAAATRIMCETTTNGSANAQAFQIYSANTTQVQVYCTNNTAARAINYTNHTGTKQITYLLDRSIVGSTEIASYDSGSLRTPTNSATTEQTGNFSTNDFYFGARNATGNGSVQDIDTLVIYNADTASIRASIEAIVA